MAKLSRNEILLAISELAVLYPAASVDDEQAQAMADLWLEDMGHLTAKQFRDAVVHWRKNQRFFPTVADIVKTRKDLDAMQPRRPSHKALERPRDHEQTSKVVALVQQIIRSNPNMGYSQAYRQAKQEIA